jgi:hypothetical protein
MLSWTALPSVITCVSWIPWVLATTIAVFGEAERRAVLKDAVGLAACTAMMILGGHLQFCAYGLMACAFVAVWLLIEQAFVQKVGAKLSLGRFGLTFAALAAGAMLAAPQLLPVLSYAKFSHRANVASGEGYKAYVAGAIPSHALQGLAFPTALGDPATPLEGGIQGENGYWPALTNAGSNFAETALGIGPLIFLLVFYLKKPRRGAAALIALSVIALLIALGTALNTPLYFLLPGWSASGSPGRIAVLFVLASCVLAGLACGNLGFGSPKVFFAKAALLGLIGLVLGLAPMVFSIPYPNPYRIPEGTLETIINRSVSAQLPIIALTLIVAVAALLASRKPKLQIVLPFCVAAIATASYGWNLIPTGSPVPKFKADTVARYAFVNSGAWPLVGSIPTSLVPPNMASASRIHEIAGYDSLLHRDSVAALHAIDGQDAAPPANGNMMLVKPNADPRALAEAGVTAVWSVGPLTQFGTPAITQGGVFEYVLPGPGRISGARAAKIEAEDFRSLTIKATGPGMLTIRDRMMPGWTAQVDGKIVPLQAVDSSLGTGLWRGVQLTDGDHQVFLSYSPPGFQTGLAFTAISLILCLAALVKSRGQSAQ